MTFVRPVELDQLPPDARAAVDGAAAQYGQVLHTWRMVGHNPAALAAYFPYVRAIFGPSALSQRIKDLTAVRVCILNHCRYSTSHRVASARRQGIGDEDLVALLDPRAHTDRFDAQELAALDFAAELTLRVAEVGHADEPQAVSEDVRRRVREQFEDAELADLALSVSLWNALTRFHRVMDLELDMPPPPPAIDAAL
jgi:alkylhydroperoxidase family enzyme